MRNKEYELIDKISEASVNLSKALMALEEFTGTYSWDIEPTPDKAKSYGSSCDPENSPKDEEISYRLLADYQKILWLVDVAHDYCWNASKALKESQTEAE